MLYADCRMNVAIGCQKRRSELEALWHCAYMWGLVLQATMGDVVSCAIIVPLLSVYKLHKNLRIRKQRTTGSVTSTWQFIVSIHSSDNSRMVKVKSYLTSSPKLKQLDFLNYYDV